MAMQWTSLGTNSVIPANLAPNLPGGGLSAPKVSMLQAWVESVYDTARDRAMIVRTGGHADGAHNGVRAFSHTTGIWTQLKADSLAYIPISQTTATFLPTYPDGSPASVHSYDGCCYMPPPFDKVWSAGGIYWSPAGLSSPPTTFLYDNVLNTYTTVAQRPGGYSCQSVWDPLTRRVLFRTSGGFYAYDPTLNTYTTLFTGANPSGGTALMGSSLLLDEQNRRVYIILNKATTGPFRINYIDLNNLSAKDTRFITTSGDTVIETVAGVGAMVDGSGIVAYGNNAANTAGELYMCAINFTAQTGVWTRLSTTGGATPPRPIANGTWKKFYRRTNGHYAILDITGIWDIDTDFTTIPPVQTKQVAVFSDLAFNYATDSTPTPPTPPGGTNELPANKWILVPALPTGTPATIRPGKHYRMAWHPPTERFFLTGGDRRGSDEGQPMVELFDPTTGLSTIASPQCVPYPGYMPNFPDNVGWCYDSTRDKFLMFRGFYFRSADNIKTTGITLGISSTTSNTITATSSAAIFQSWMPNAVRPADGGTGIKILETVSLDGVGTVIGEAVITGYTSTTAVTASVINAFSVATPSNIAARTWVLHQALRGKAAWATSSSTSAATGGLFGGCNRNALAGDTGILDDCMFNPTSLLWEPPTWPPNPLGSSDASGPTWADYDEDSDCAFLIKNRTSLLILHRNTNTWETVSFGLGMTAGAEKTFVQGANTYRSQIVCQGGFVNAFCANDTDGAGLVRYEIATRTWHGYTIPGYVLVPDDTEPSLIYAPDDNALYHLRCTSLTGSVTNMYRFDLDTLTWSEVTITYDTSVPSTEVLKLGMCSWDPTTRSIIIHGRQATGVPGNPCWHYRPE